MSFFTGCAFPIITQESNIRIADMSLDHALWVVQGLIEKTCKPYRPMDGCDSFSDSQFVPYSTKQLNMALQWFKNAKNRTVTRVEG